jgi:hypothetical protein
LIKAFTERKMKRTDLVLALAVVTGIMIPGVGRSAQPCPPPYVSVDGGTSSTTDCPVGASYATSFPGIENPISEGGAWVNGLAVGLDWNNPKTTGGKAVGSVAMTGSRYADDIGHLSTSLHAFSANQWAQGTVYKASGYTGGGGSHEIELLLRFQITAHNARGYEILWGLAGYIAIVRWNGPVGNYTPLYDPGTGSIAPPVDGDVLRAEMNGSTITVYKNGVRVASVSDSTYASGQPGIGFWPVDGATPENMGWKAFQAGNL